MQNPRHLNRGAGQNQEVAQPLKAADALQARRLNDAKAEARRRDQLRFQRAMRAQEFDFVRRARALPTRAQFLGHGKGRENVPTRSARDHQNSRSRRRIVSIHFLVVLIIYSLSPRKSKSKGKA
jgi:hypothetical protein